MLFDNTHKEMLGCGVLILFAIPATLAIWLGLNCLIALLAQYVFGGLGHPIPFWPTVGAIFLVQIVLGGIGSTFRSK